MEHLKNLSTCILADDDPKIKRITTALELADCLSWRLDNKARLDAVKSIDILAWATYVTARLLQKDFNIDTATRKQFVVFMIHLSATATEADPVIRDINRATTYAFNSTTDDTCSLWCTDLALSSFKLLSSIVETEFLEQHQLTTAITRSIKAGSITLKIAAVTSTKATTNKKGATRNNNVVNFDTVNSGLKVSKTASLVAMADARTPEADATRGVPVEMQATAAGDAAAARAAAVAAAVPVGRSGRPAQRRHAKAAHGQNAEAVLDARASMLPNNEVDNNADDPGNRRNSSISQTVNGHSSVASNISVKIAQLKSR